MADEATTDTGTGTGADVAAGLDPGLVDEVARIIHDATTRVYWSLPRSTPNKAWEMDRAAARAVLAHFLAALRDGLAGTECGACRANAGRLAFEAARKGQVVPSPPTEADLAARAGYDRAPCQACGAHKKVSSGNVWACDGCGARSTLSSGAAPGRLRCMFCGEREGVVGEDGLRTCLECGEAW